LLPSFLGDREVDSRIQKLCSLRPIIAPAKTFGEPQKVQQSSGFPVLEAISFAIFALAPEQEEVCFAETSHWHLSTKRRKEAPNAEGANEKSRVEEYTLWDKV